MTHTLSIYPAGRFFSLLLYLTQNVKLDNLASAELLASEELYSACSSFSSLFHFFGLRAMSHYFSGKDVLTT